MTWEISAIGHIREWAANCGKAVYTAERAAEKSIGTVCA